MNVAYYRNPSVKTNLRLHLGVVDVPYDDGKATTGDVAQILEDE